MKMKLVVLMYVVTSHCFALQEGEIAEKYAFNKSILTIKIRLTQLEQERESLIKDKSEHSANKEALKKIDKQLVDNFNESFRLIDYALVAIQARIFEIDEESDEFEAIQDKAEIFEEKRSMLVAGALAHLPKRTKWSELAPTTQSAILIAINKALMGDYLVTFKKPENQEPVESVFSRFNQAVALQASKQKEEEKKAEEIKAHKAALPSKEALLKDKIAFKKLALHIKIQLRELEKESREITKYRAVILQKFLKSAKKDERQALASELYHTAQDGFEVMSKWIENDEHMIEAYKKRIEFIKGTADSGEIPWLAADLKMWEKSVATWEQLLKEGTIKSKERMKELQRIVDETVENIYEEQD